MPVAPAAWPDGPIADPDWLNGFVDAAAMEAKITARFNLLVARVGQQGPTAIGITGVNPSTGATTGGGRSTIGTQNLFQTGPAIVIYANVTLAADIAVGGNGNAANTPIAAIDPAYRPTSGFGQGLGSGPTGRLIQYYCNNSGLIFVASTTGGNMLAGDVVSVSGTIYDI